MGVEEAFDNADGHCEHCDRYMKKGTDCWGAKYFVKLDDLCNVDSILEELSEPTVKEVEHV